MPKCHYCGNEVPSAVKDYSCQFCGEFLCTSCYYTTQGVCYNCYIQLTGAETPTEQYQLEEIINPQELDLEAPTTENGSQKISGALDELMDLASAAEDIKIKKTSKEAPLNPLTPSEDLIQPEEELLQPRPSQGELLGQSEDNLSWDVGETQEQQDYIPEGITSKRNLEFDEQAIRDSVPDVVGYIPGSYKKQNVESWGVGGPQDQQDYVPEGIKKRRQMQFDEQAIRDSAPDVVGYIPESHKKQNAESWSVGGPQDQQDYVPEGIKKRRQMQFDEQAIRDSAPDIVGYVPPKEHSQEIKTFGIGGPQDQQDYVPEGIKKRRQMKFDEQAIRDSAPDLITSVPTGRTKRMEEVQDWSPRDMQEDWVPEELKIKRQQLEVDMAAIRDAADDYIPKELKAQRNQLEIDMQKIRESVDDFIPKELLEKRKQLEVDMDKIRDSAHDYIPNHLKDKRKQLEVDMAKIRDAADYHIPKELIQKRTQLQVDMAKIREAATDYTPEEYKKRKEALEVDMEKIRQQAVDYIPEELKLEKRRIEVDMAKIRDAADDFIPKDLIDRKIELEVDMEKIRQQAHDYIPEELKAKRHQLKVDMSKIRDSAEDYIPEEIKRQREKIEVNMVSISDAAQDYIPEVIQKVRYEFDEDAIRQADDVIPEEFRGVKRQRAKVNEPSFLQYSPTEDLIAEDDDLLKSLSYHKRERLQYDEELSKKIRDAQDVIPEEIKRKRIKKGVKPKIQSGYTYERIDAEQKKKWEKEGGVIVDKSQIKKVEYDLKDNARDAASDVIPEDIKKFSYEFDEDSIRTAKDIILEEVRKVQYNFKDSARDAAEDYIPEEVKHVKREHMKKEGPTFTDVDKEKAEEWKQAGVTNVKKPKLKSYFDELEEKAKGTTVSKVDSQGKISSYTLKKEKKKIDVQQLSAALRSKAKDDEGLLTSKPFPGRKKVAEQQKVASQLEMFMFLTFLGKLLFNPSLIKNKLL